MASGAILINDIKQRIQTISIMLMNHPNGEVIDWSPDGEFPEDFLMCIDLMCIDCTFPYAYGYDCPVSVITVVSFGRDGFNSEMGKLHRNLDHAVSYMLDGNEISPVFKKKSPRLAELIENIYEGVSQNKGEACRDGYQDLQAFITYIENIVELSPTYWEATEGEDDGGMPGMTSGYVVHWDNNPKQAITFISKLVHEDNLLLKAESYKKRSNPR